MSEMKSSPGEVIDVGTLQSGSVTAEVVPLIKTSELEIFRVVLPSGSTVPAHEFSREVVVHCLEGRVELTWSSGVHDLAAGQMIQYCSYERFSLRGLEDSSLLITAALSKTGESIGLIG